MDEALTVGDRRFEVLCDDAEFAFELPERNEVSVILARQGGLRVVLLPMTDEMPARWHVSCRGARTAVRWVFECLSRGTLEAREGQQDLSCRVAGSVLYGEVLVAEAPTGVGKTLAYMVGGYVASSYVRGLEGVPVLESCPVVVATATKALQEQVWEKDVPKFVSAGLWSTDDVALLKGKGSYLCLDRAERALKDWDSAEDGDAEMAARLSAQGWSTWGPVELEKMVRAVRHGKWNGDFDGWNVVKLKRASGVEVDGSQCLGRQCESFMQCPYMRLRGSLGRKKLIVTNHDLVLSDLGVRTMTKGAGRVLPVTSYAVIFDEGHHLVSKGIEQGESEITEGGLTSLAETLTWLMKDLGVHRKGKGQALLSSKIWGLYERLASSSGVTELVAPDAGPQTRKMRGVYAGLVERIFEEEPNSRASGVHRLVYSRPLPVWIAELWEQHGQFVVNSRKILAAASTAYATVSDELVKEAASEGLSLEQKVKLREWARLAKQGQIRAQGGLEIATHVYRVWKFWLEDGDTVKWVKWPKAVDSEVPAWERAEVTGVDEDWKEGRDAWSLHVCPLRASQYLVPGVWSWVRKQAGAEDPYKSFWLRGCSILSATLRGTSSFDLLSDDLGLLRQAEGVSGHGRVHLRTREERQGTDVFRGIVRPLLKSSVPVGYLAVKPVFDASKSALRVVDLGASGGYPERRLFAARVCAAVPELLEPLLDPADGGGGEGALILCNSWEMLRVLARDAVPALEAKGWTVRIQGSTGAAQLVEQHVAAVRGGELSLLLGTQSLAEGLDLPGDLCMHVVLVSLPFPSNKSPLEAALEEVLGHRYFEDRSLQEVAIKLVQMTGRLVRSHSDWGTITVLDSRLHSKGYGKRLRSRLPAYEWEVCDWSQKLAHVQPKAYAPQSPNRRGESAGHKGSGDKKHSAKKESKGAKKKGTPDGSGNLF